MADARERSYLSLVPWRNFRRVLFLILALLGVVALKKSGGGLFHNILDSVAPPGPSPAGTSPSAHPTRAPVPETTVHLKLGPPPK